MNIEVKNVDIKLLKEQRDALIGVTNTINLAKSKDYDSITITVETKNEEHFDGVINLLDCIIDKGEINETF